MQFKEASISNFPISGDQRRFFDKPEWLQITSACFGLTTRFFRFDVVAGEVFMALQEDQNAFFANYMGYGGPLGVSNIEERSLCEMLRSISLDMQKPIRRMKLYPFVDLIPATPSRFERKVTSLLDLRTEFVSTKEVRYEIRKAEKRGIVTRILDARDIDAFYNVYLETARRVGSLYITPKALFLNIVSLDGCFILGGFFEDRLIGGSVFLNSGDWSYYWWNGTNEFGRRSSVNYLLMKHAIEILRQRRFFALDMASSHSDAIREFKKKWGAVDAPYFEYLG